MTYFALDRANRQLVAFKSLLDVRSMLRSTHAAGTCHYNQAYHDKASSESHHSAPFMKEDYASTAIGGRAFFLLGGMNAIPSSFKYAYSVSRQLDLGQLKDEKSELSCGC